MLSEPFAGNKLPKWFVVCFGRAISSVAFTFGESDVTAHGIPEFHTGRDRRRFVRPVKFGGAAIPDAGQFDNHPPYFVRTNEIALNYRQSLYGDTLGARLIFFGRQEVPKLDSFAFVDHSS